MARETIFRHGRLVRELAPAVIYGELAELWKDMFGIRSEALWLIAIRLRRQGGIPGRLSCVVRIGTTVILLCWIHRLLLSMSGRWKATVARSRHARRLEVLRTERRPTLVGRRMQRAGLSPRSHSRIRFALQRRFRWPIKLRIHVGRLLASTGCHPACKP